MPRRALFLDRDGVINVDSGYVHRADQVVFIDGIFTLVRAARAAGFCVIVVTNQAGIARGYYTEADFLRLTGWLRQRFAASGACLDAVYHCPHHPQHGIGALRCECICRKPAPGMLLRAAQEHDIDLSASILIGDNRSDMLAAVAAGIGVRYLLRHNVGGSGDVDDVSGRALELERSNLPEDDCPNAAGTDAAGTDAASAGCHGATAVITHLWQLLPYLDAPMQTATAEVLQRLP